MSLEQILEKINNEKVVAEMDLDTVSPRALPYKKGQVESAKHRLEGLYIDYKNELLKRAVFILVTGEESSQFADIAKEEYSCFSTDGKVMFKEIVDQLSPDLYVDKTVNAPIFDVVGNILEDKMKMLDIVSYNSLIFNAKYQKTVKTKGDMVDVVKEAISDIVGGEVIGLDALERVTSEAVNKNYKSGIVPILIHSNDENFILNISDSLRKLNPRVVRVAAGKTENDINPLVSTSKTDENQVGKALKEIAENA